MPHLAKPDEVENLEFKWGKKRGTGGKKKDIQFYESFSYDCVEYSLYDSVYMHKEGEPEPYIGKLIKIWENPDKSKKVKVQWFFRPLEILEWLIDMEVLENELFFASGEGVGLANVNPLEAIAGKCNVVCISKDCRNPQPSDERIKRADYVFYRTFDVGNRTILNKLDDKVGGLEIKFIVNPKENETASSVSQVSPDRKEDNGNAVACNDVMQISPPDEVKTVIAEGNYTQSVVREDAQVKNVFVYQESSHGGKPALCAIVDQSAVHTTGVGSEHVSGGKTTSCKVASYKDEGKGCKVDVVQVAEKITSVKGTDALEDRSSKKARVDSYANTNGIQKSTVLGNDEQGLVGDVSSSDKTVKFGHAKDFLRMEKGIKSAKDSVSSDERQFKKARVDSSIKLSKDENKESFQNLSIDSWITPVSSSEEKTKSRLAKESLGLDKGPPKKEKLDEKTNELSNGKLLKVSADEDRKPEGQTFEVTRKPDVDKSNWFRALPWEERMQRAHEQGTLVLLWNLDRDYTSGDVEDIMWHAFKENCAAQMVQRTAISSPHSGQAFVIFKTREAAERVVRKLDDGCLMLSNGRPLVGCFGTPLRLPGKQSTFVGHLSVDKFKMQREMKEAVSTSHCSQPNTIEYEMAMEWCLLQSRSDTWWKKLHKQQGEELRKLVTNFKSK